MYIADVIAILDAHPEEDGWAVFVTVGCVAFKMPRDEFLYRIKDKYRAKSDDRADRDLGLSVWTDDGALTIEVSQSNDY